MRIGDKILTSLGEVTVLDIQEKYLILFKVNGEFVKANDYKMIDNKYVWNGGEYYSNLTELFESMEKEKI